MLINAVPLICQQRLALALLNPSGYTVNPSCTCRTSYSRAAWCSTLYYSRCTHSHPATRSTARGTPASSAASPAYVRARSSPPVPCTTRVRDPPADAPSRYRPAAAPPTAPPTPGRTRSDPLAALAAPRAAPASPMLP